MNVVAATEIKRKPFAESFEPEHVMVACLLHQMKQMPKEALADLLEVASLFPQANSQEEAREMFETMREILFPQMNGGIAEPEQVVSAEHVIKRSIYIGSKIKQEREVAGITQEELAQATGLAQSHVSRLENGQHSPAWRTLEKIAEALKIDVRKLDPLAE